MNAPRQPVGDHDAEPDPEELVSRWEVTGCAHCGGLIYRAHRRRPSSPGGWRHVPADEDRAEDGQP